MNPTSTYTKNNVLKLRTCVCLVIVFISVFSCSDFIDVGPPKTEIISETVFTSDAAATSAVRGIFSMMISDQSFSAGQLERFTGLSSDELRDNSGDDLAQQFFKNTLVSTNGDIDGAFWDPAYKYISNANAILEGLGSSTALTPETKSILTGEAKFIRAYCHFYLVNLFGDVPYVTTTDYRVNSIAVRTASEDVYKMIIADLNDAVQLLPDGFSFANNQRIEPNKFAAIALLARVYLFHQEWANAVTLSSQVIASPDYKLNGALDSVFLANNTEAIWQLSPVTSDKSTPQGKLFLINIAPNRISLTDELYSSFEAGDLRKTSWTALYNDGKGDYHYPTKYKVYLASTLTEYSTMLRLAEQFLIRAEARAQLNNLNESIADVDVIRKRAGLNLIESTNPGISQSDLLLAIEQERRAELFTEGHRWLDLKRTGRATNVLSPLKQAWQAPAVLYPIPQSEITLDTNLTQNPSY